MTNPSTHSASEGTPRPSERHEYVVHNYDAYNIAINNTLDQHRSLMLSLKSEVYIRWLKILSYVLAALCLTALTVAVIYWLLFASPNVAGYRGEMGSEREMNTLASNEAPNSLEITTLFTVFTKTPTSTGELIVTAKNYSRSDLSNPDSQYCYITTSGDINDAEIEIAYIDDGEIKVIATDDYLISEAVPLCQFLEPK